MHTRSGNNLAAHLIELVELRESPLYDPHQAAVSAQLDHEGSVPVRVNVVNAQDEHSVAQGAVACQDAGSPLAVQMPASERGPFHDGGTGCTDTVDVSFLRIWTVRDGIHGSQLKLHCVR